MSGSCPQEPRLGLEVMVKSWGGGVLHYWDLAKIEAATFDPIQSHTPSHRSSMNIVEAHQHLEP